MRYDQEKNLLSVRTEPDLDVKPIEVLEEELRTEIAKREKELKGKRVRLTITDQTEGYSGFVRQKLLKLSCDD